MFVAMSRFTVANGMSAEVRDAFMRWARRHTETAEADP
jgi:hypothetical protein